MFDKGRKERRKERKGEREGGREEKSSGNIGDYVFGPVWCRRWWTGAIFIPLIEG